MERITKAATVTATTDVGEFTAIAAAYSIDRSGDRIIPGAFAKTIAQWQGSGKRVPLHWNHKGDAHNIIGSLDPSSMAEVDAGLQVSGQLDLKDSETAREAWRSMKGGSMSLSFGYLATRGKTAADGVNDLLELDLFEVSIVPAPANPDTRILSMKSAEADELNTELQDVRDRLEKLEKALDDQKKADVTDKEPSARSVDPLRQQAEKAALEVASGGLSQLTQPKQAPAPEPLDLIPVDELKRQSRHLMLQVLSGMEP